MEQIITDGLSFSLPLFVMAIGGLYSEKSGITNLALEGLQGFGAFVGAFVAAVLMDRGTVSSTAIFYIALLFAVIGGAVYSLLHALLCIRFKANQVISGVVVNIFAMSFTAFLTKLLNKLIFKTPSDKFVLDIAPRISIPVLRDIPVIGAVFDKLYPFELIIVVITVIAWYVLYKTSFGMNLRACGDNPHAVDAAGLNVSRIRTIAVLISGGLSGLAGISFAYSISANFSSGIYVGYGYLAIAAMIFGNWNLLPTVCTCLFFGFAKSLGYYVVRLMELPSSYSDLVMTIPYIATMILLMFFSKYNRAPRALGEIYDKGKR